MILFTAAGCAHGRLPELPPEEWHQAARWPLPPDPPRLLCVGELRGGADIVESRGFFGWLGDVVLGESEERALRWPLGLATADGKLLVADGRAAGVWLLDVPRAESRLLRELADGQNLVAPVDVAMDGDGNIYVSDTELKVVARFTADGDPLPAIGKGTLQRPTGLAWRTAPDELLVVDTGAHQVVVYDSQGRERSRFGQRGEGAGQLNFPLFVATGRDGHAWVVDAMNARVQRFDRAGKWVSGFGFRGNAPGAFASPKGIALDGDGNIYVADALFDNIQVFDQQGTLLLVFGGHGTALGQMSLPEGLAVDQENRIFIADALNRRIQICRYLPEVAP